VLGLLAPMLTCAVASAATIVVTPGEQNTQSGENGCDAAPCAGGHWLHYPELLKVALGAGYTVQNNGDGGAVLGCDAATATVAGGNSFCKSGKYTASIAGPPNIAVIGPFGEHDQRILVSSAQNETTYDNQTTFEGAYEGLVQDYLKLNAKVLMMTPIDVPWGGTADLPGGKHLVKDTMLPAALKVAKDHNLKVIDTYTEISGTPALVQMYYDKDGQVNMAGQQKMADLVLAAIKSPDNMGGSGGAGGMGGTGGTSAGSGGQAGTPSGGTSSGSGGAPGGGSGTTAGSGGSVVTSAGTPAVGGTGGNGGAAAAGTAPVISAPTSSSDSSGCSFSRDDSAWGAGLALLGVACAALARKRKS
jgi:hypothetical protein